MLKQNHMENLNYIVNNHSLYLIYLYIILKQIIHIIQIYLSSFFNFLYHDVQFSQDFSKSDAFETGVYYCRSLLLIFPYCYLNFQLFHYNTLQMSSNITTGPLKEDQFLNLFLQVYSLPKYAEQIGNTIFQSIERSQRIFDLRNKIITLFKKMGEDPTQYIKDFSAESYLRAKNFLKQKVVIHYESIYPNTISFKIVNKINDKLNDKYQKQCEGLLSDLIKYEKDKDLKRYVEGIIEKKFKSYDKDGSGFINIQELESRLESLSLPKLMAKQIMDKADTEKNGLISFKEFRAYTEHQIIKYYKLFYNLDSDNDYKLNYLQTKQSLHEIYPDLKIGSVFDQIFRTMDQDGSGFINFQEWCEFLIVFPQTNFNMMMNQWAMYATTMVDPEESSSFINRDLLKSTKIKNGKRVLSYWDILRTLTFGAIAGGISRTVTAPLERLKVLYQTMYTDTKCPSISAGLKQSYMKDGLYALFKGNSISISLNCVEQALRFTIIEYSKKTYQIRGDKIYPHEFLYIGVITGILSSLVLFPFDVLRIRFITSQDKSVLHQAKQIYHKSGPRGFYSGLTPYLISVLPAGSFNVMSYNTLRGMLVTDKDIEHPNIYKFMLIGGLGALITNTFIYPLSLITSRMIVANKEIQLFKDKIKMHQMAKKIFEHEGISGFYKGYKASTLRVFIGQSLNFGTYETLKSLWTMKNNYFNPKKQKY